VRVCKRVKAPKKKPTPRRKPVAPAADLVLSGTVSPDDASAGDPVVYRVTVRNRGPKVAKDVVVVVQSPIGVDSVSTDPAGGSCDRPGRGPTAFRCRVGTLAVGASWTVELEGRAVGEGRLRFAALVRSSTRDPAPKNGATEEEVTVKPAGAPGHIEPPPPPLQPQPAPAS
jgi:uncharacterized repeat protein (TIGR01451 family)